MCRGLWPLDFPVSVPDEREVAAQRCCGGTGHRDGGGRRRQLRDEGDEEADALRSQQLSRGEGYSLGAESWGVGGDELGYNLNLVPGEAACQSP